MEGSSSQPSSSQPSSQPSHLSRHSSPSRLNEPSSPGAEKITKETLPKQSEERGEPETQASSLIESNWPSLPIASETDSPIQPGQEEKPPSSASWKVRQKGPEDHEKDRVGKYAQ